MSIFPKLRKTKVKLSVKFFIGLGSLIAIVFAILGIVIIEYQKSILLEINNERMIGNLHGLENLLDLQRKEKESKVQLALATAHKLLNDAGTITEDKNELVSIDATEQISKAKCTIKINPWYLNGSQVLNSVGLVDNVLQLTNCKATIFQKIPEGFIQISTNVLNNSGKRSIGTYVSNTSPIARTVSMGATYTGRAFVMNEWYISCYEPIKIDNEIKGMLYVGIPEKDMGFLKEKFNDNKCLSHGFAALTDSFGNFLLTPKYVNNSKLDSSVFQNVLSSQTGHSRIQISGANISKWAWLYYKYYAPYKCYIIATVFEEDIIDKPASEIRKILVIGIMVSMLIFFVCISYIFRTITKPIDKIVNALRKLSKGIFVDNLDIKLNDEIGEISDSVNSLITGLKTTSDFAKEIGKKNLSADFIPLSDNDVLGNSLLEMRSSLQKAEVDEMQRKAEDEKRNWATEGMALFAEILRQNTNDVNMLSYEIIKNIVNYLKANQGGLFLYNDDDPDDRYLEQISVYAFNRKKFAEKKIRMGEGLVGLCAIEKESIYMTDIPDGYIEITSGLGKANPRSVLIVPMKLEEDIFGVIEIASFIEFKKYEIEFVEKVCQSIASTISNVKVNIRTALLLQQSREQSEELRAQEEEMLQNLEELTSIQDELRNKDIKQQEEIEYLNKENHEKFSELKAAQDDMKRNENILKWNLDAINKTVALIEYDFNGIIQQVNDMYCKMSGYSKDDLIGQHHRILVSEEYAESKEYKTFWNNMTNGKIFDGVFERISKTKAELNLNGTIKPLFDNNDLPVKIMEAGVNISEMKKMERDIHSQNDELKQQEEELRQFIEELSTAKEQIEIMAKEEKKRFAEINMKNEDEMYKLYTDLMAKEEAIMKDAELRKKKDLETICKFEDLLFESHQNEMSLKSKIEELSGIMENKKN